MTRLLALTPSHHDPATALLLQHPAHAQYAAQAHAHGQQQQPAQAQHPAYAQQQQHQQHLPEQREEEEDQQKNENQSSDDEDDDYDDEDDDDDKVERMMNEKEDIHSGEEEGVMERTEEDQFKEEEGEEAVEGMKDYQKRRGEKTIEKMKVSQCTEQEGEEVEREATEEMKDSQSEEKEVVENRAETTEGMKDNQCVEQQEDEEECVTIEGVEDSQYNEQEEGIEAIEVVEEVSQCVEKRKEEVEEAFEEVENNQEKEEEQCEAEEAIERMQNSQCLQKEEEEEATEITDNSQCLEKLEEGRENKVTEEKDHHPQENGGGKEVIEKMEENEIKTTKVEMEEAVEKEKENQSPVRKEETIERTEDKLCKEEGKDAMDTIVSQSEEEEGGEEEVRERVKEGGQDNREEGQGVMKEGMTNTEGMTNEEGKAQIEEDRKEQIEEERKEQIEVSQKGMEKGELEKGIKEDKLEVKQEMDNNESEMDEKEMKNDMNTNRQIVEVEEGNQPEKEVVEMKENVEEEKVVGEELKVSQNEKVEVEMIKKSDQNVTEEETGEARENNNSEMEEGMEELENKNEIEEPEEVTEDTHNRMEGEEVNDEVNDRNCAKGNTVKEISEKEDHELQTHDLEKTHNNDDDRDNIELNFQPVDDYVEAKKDVSRESEEGKFVSFHEHTLQNVAGGFSEREEHQECDCEVNMRVCLSCDESNNKNKDSSLSLCHSEVSNPKDEVVDDEQNGEDSDDERSDNDDSNEKRHLTENELVNHKVHSQEVFQDVYEECDRKRNVGERERTMETSKEGKLMNPVKFEIGGDFNNGVCGTDAEEKECVPCKDNQSGELSEAPWEGEDNSEVMRNRFDVKNVRENFKYSRKEQEQYEKNGIPKETKLMESELYDGNNKVKVVVGDKKKSLSNILESHDQPSEGVKPTPNTTTHTPSTTTFGPSITNQGPSITTHTCITTHTSCITNQGPSITTHTSSIITQGPSISNQGPNITNQGPNITNQGPSTTNQSLSITNQSPSITNHGPSITNQGPSATNQGPSATHQNISRKSETLATLSSWLKTLPPAPLPGPQCTCKVPGTPPWKLAVTPDAAEEFVFETPTGGVMPWGSPCSSHAAFVAFSASSSSQCSKEVVKLRRSYYSASTHFLMDTTGSRLLSDRKKKSYSSDILKGFVGRKLDDERSGSNSEGISFPTQEDSMNLRCSNFKEVKERRWLFRSKSLWAPKADQEEGVSVSPFTSPPPTLPSLSVCSSSSSVSPPLCSFSQIPFTTPSRWTRAIEGKRKTIQSCIFPDSYSEASSPAFVAKVPSRVQSEPNVAGRRPVRTAPASSQKPSSSKSRSIRRRTIMSCISSDTDGEDFTPYIAAVGREESPQFQNIMSTHSSDQVCRIPISDVDGRGHQQIKVLDLSDSLKRNKSCGALETATIDPQLAQTESQRLFTDSRTPARMDSRLRHQFSLRKRPRPQSLIIIPESQVAQLETPSRVMESTSLRKPEGLVSLRTTKFSSCSQRSFSHPPNSNQCSISPAESHTSASVVVECELKSPCRPPSSSTPSPCHQPLPHAILRHEKERRARVEEVTARVMEGKKEPGKIARSKSFTQGTAESLMGRLRSLGEGKGRSVTTAVSPTPPAPRPRSLFFRRPSPTSPDQDKFEGKPLYVFVVWWWGGEGEKIGRNLGRILRRHKTKRWGGGKITVELKESPWSAGGTFSLIPKLICFEGLVGETG
ncbi:hypothetical protein Pcinc_028601 [Petrolisthes cinctipes]|uniref:Uncharacterized protein n=1 Tax=Petrolisthes cinctipes TaxID=88211 RepID=A0AAE1K929_PETCI|nr:hypothetical protein Pcinc_028601 [Petrolisthes cinctipes]